MEVYVLLIVLTIIFIYCVYYVIENNLILFLINIIFKMLKDTYMYTLGLLTATFMISFLSISFLNKSFFFHTITIRSLFENPKNSTEIIFIIFYLAVLIIGIFIWSKKVLRLTENYILQINFENSLVSKVARIFCMILFIKFHLSFLMPLVIYGLLGNYGF